MSFLIFDKIPKHVGSDTDKVFKWLINHDNVYGYYRSSSYCSCCRYELFKIYIVNDGDFKIYEYYNNPICKGKNCGTRCSCDFGYKWIDLMPRLVKNKTQDLQMFYKMIKYQNTVYYHKINDNFVYNNEKAEKFFLNILKKNNKNKQNEISKNRENIIEIIADYFIDNKNNNYYGYNLFPKYGNIIKLNNKYYKINICGKQKNINPYKITKIIYDNFIFDIYTSKNIRESIYDIEVKGLEKFHETFNDW